MTGKDNAAFERIVAQETTLDEAARAGDLVVIGSARDLDSWRCLLDAAREQSLFKVKA